MVETRGGRVLILDDDRNVCEFLARVLADDGIAFSICHGLDKLGELQQGSGPFHLIIANLGPLDASPVALVAHLATLFPGVPVLHLHEVIPFSAEEFLRRVWERMGSDRAWSQME